MTLDKEKLFATQRETLKAQTDSIDANFLPEYSQRIPILLVRTQPLLDERYAETWSIRHLSRQAAINECDLKREFKALTGSTINHYHRAKRMQVALALLQSGEYNLAEIADSIGYHSKDYFVRVFTEYYGSHPKSML